MKTWQNVAAIIRAHREKIKLRQKDLNHVLGARLMSNIENNRAGLPLKHLMKTCAALEIDQIDMAEAVINDFELRLKQYLPELDFRVVVERGDGRLTPSSPLSIHDAIPLPIGTHKTQ